MVDKEAKPSIVDTGMESPAQEANQDVDPTMLLKMIAGLTMGASSSNEQIQKISEELDEGSKKAEEAAKRLELQTQTVESLMKEIEELKNSGTVAKEKRQSETKLSKGFGEDTSPRALRAFLSHFVLVKQQNEKRGVTLWKDASYRAGELRIALSGEVAEYLDAEDSMGSTWVRSDTEIMEHLKARYMKTECIELNILAFEEARQSDNETLANYLTRLQQLGQNAFPKNPEGILRQRVVWRFLAGLADSDVRKALITSKWMADETNAKEYTEILKIAQSAKMTKSASSSLATSKTQKGNVRSAGIKHADSRDKKKSPTGPNTTQSPADSSDRPVFVCWYCKEKHPGGWRRCEKRKKEAPDWRPGGDKTPMENKKPQNF